MKYEFDMLPDWRVPMLPGRIPSRIWWFRRMSSSTDSHTELPRFANRPPVYKRRDDKWCKKIEITIIPHMADVSTTWRVNGAKRVVSLSSNVFAHSANFYQWLCLDCRILQKSFENQSIPMVRTLCMVALFVRPS